MLRRMPTYAERGLTEYATNIIVALLTLVADDLVSSKSVGNQIMRSVGSYPDVRGNIMRVDATALLGMVPHGDHQDHESVVADLLATYESAVDTARREERSPISLLQTPLASSFVAHVDLLTASQHATIRRTTAAPQNRTWKCLRYSRLIRRAYAFTWTIR